MLIKTTTIDKPTTTAQRPVLDTPFIRAANAEDLLPDGPTQPSPLVDLALGKTPFYLVGMGPATAALAGHANMRLSGSDTLGLLSQIATKANAVDGALTDAALPGDASGRLETANQDLLEDLAKALPKVNKGAQAATKLVAPAMAVSAAPLFAGTTAIVGGIAALDAFANDRSAMAKGLSLGWFLTGAGQVAAIYKPKLKPVVDAASNMQLVASGAAAGAHFLQTRGYME